MDYLPQIVNDYEYESIYRLLEYNDATSGTGLSLFPFLSYIALGAILVQADPYLKFYHIDHC